MIEKKEFNANSLKDAIALAAKEYKIDEEEIKYKIIPEKTKYFGHKNKEIFISAWINNSDQEITKVTDYLKEITRLMLLELEIHSENHKGFLRINISGKDFKLILYKNGDLLNAFQYLLNRLFSVSLEKKIYCECQNFRKNREKELSRLAHKYAKNVKRNGKAIQLKDLNPFERRIIHMTVNKYNGIESISNGDSFLKVITIKNK